MKKFIKTLFRYTGIAFGLMLMLLGGCFLFHAIMLLLTGIFHGIPLYFLQAFFIVFASLIGISIGFQVFEYFGERY